MTKKRFDCGGYQVPRAVFQGNDLRLARYRRVPELGPRVLFFSGGTALKHFSEVLADYTHNSIHLVTPFDSGGSSAELRRAFSMPAVGDLRARLLSLADHSVTGHPDIAALFSLRLDANAEKDELMHTLLSLVQARHPLLKAIAEPMRSLIRSYLEGFYRQMPEDFNLAGASVGNLILTGGYLLHNRSLDPIAFLFGQLIKTRGIVRTTTDADLQLQVELESGRIIHGQHRFTGKETAQIDSPVRSIRLSGDADDVDALGASKVCKETRQLIGSAELLVFPPGSFYSSLIANLLPKGVVKALARNPAPRVYVPNLGTDLEALGMTLSDQVRVLARHLSSGKQAAERQRPPIDFLLLDSCLLDVPESRLAQIRDQWGIQVIDVDLASEAEVERYDDRKLAEALLALT
ncbi:CofD-related protein, GAK system [Marinobacter persicus]|uniref:CofD-related protein, GAK system n=1 Tax=Marinobacter persicus TaxID=930118 RepID=A0A1I3VS24_9GAMM|nr:GAK system CofD-like protein [Marinobacter persicus]NWO05291.1 GAK system CofD-like protein [Alteromonadaceae bacterium]SFJ97723.1 CofD-related protein, GAK system [Marinobacter persicus]